MLLIPVPTRAFMPYVVSTTEHFGYAGLVVVLARTADARSQHEELVRDWTSLHDVTGPLLAVLCPDPHVSTDALAILNGDAKATVSFSRSQAISVPGLGLQHPSPQHADAFVQSLAESGFGFNYWARSDKDGKLADSFVQGLDESGSNSEFRPDRDRRRKFFARSRAPRQPEEHQAAWTEATSRCAEYFGISEKMVPSVLILSFWEKAAILIRLQPHISLYELIKAAVEIMGNKPREIDRLHQEIVLLKQSLRELRDEQAPWLAANRPFVKWRSKLDKFNRKLEETTGIDPALVADCQDGLGKFCDSDQVGDLPTNLRALHLTLCSHQSSSGLRHSDVWGLISQLESRSFPPTPAERDLYSQPIREVEAQLKQSQNQEWHERYALHLSDAIIAAYEGLFGAIMNVRSLGTAALASWDLRIIDIGSHPGLRAE